MRLLSVWNLWPIHLLVIWLLSKHCLQLIQQVFGGIKAELEFERVAEIYNYRRKASSGDHYAPMNQSRLIDMALAAHEDHHRRCRTTSNTKRDQDELSSTFLDRHHLAL
jgi:hypothetical protein